MPSTITTTSPPQGSALASAPVRGNFLAAATDINNILGCFAGVSPPASPSNFQLWANTSASPTIVINQFDGTTWVPIATINTTLHTYQQGGSSQLSVVSAGADPTGTADSTTKIQAAMTAVGAGTLVWPKGTYKVSSTLAMPSGQQWIGDSQGGTTIQWAGANSTDVVQISQGSFCKIQDITIDVLTATGMNGLHLMDAQFNKIWGVRCQSTGTVTPSSNSVGISVEAGHFGSGTAHNTAFNDFRSISTSFFSIGMQYFGISTGPTVATLNSVSQADLENCLTGMRYAQWCDTNPCYQLRVLVFGNNAIGVIYNDSGTPGSDVGVYNNNLFGYQIDAFGAITNATGVFFNVSKQNSIYGLLTSPDPSFPGQAYVDNSSRAFSFFIHLANNADGTNNMGVISKNHAPEKNTGVVLLGYAIGVNLNAVADTTINLLPPVGLANYRIQSVQVQNTGTTASLTAAQFGLFSAAAGGGTALIAGGTALSAITSNAINTAANAAEFSPATPVAWNFNPLFFRVTTAQGAAATGNVYIFGRPLPTV